MFYLYLVIGDKNMLILTGFSSAEATSIIIASISAVICLLALITALVIGRRDSRNRFESMVEDCLLPISIFIEDSFWVIAEKQFRSAEYIEEGEKKLVEGLHRLQVFALTNNYKYLEEVAKISYGPNEQEKNEKCFSFCLLTLEDIYIKYRQKNVSGIASQEERDYLNDVNFLFQRYLKLLSKYMFGFKSKCFVKQGNYYKELKELFKECEKYDKRDKQNGTK